MKKILNLTMESCKYHVLLFIFFVVFISSCVPVKKLTYLQYQDDLKEDNPIDTLIRSYNLKSDQYKLKAEDIISIRVASITDEEYNFINKYALDLGSIRKLGQYSQGTSGTGGGDSRVNIAGGQGTGDLTRSIVTDRPNLGFTIDLNGEIELPQIGSLKLEGLTIPEAEMMVKDSLEGYYEVPMVRIQLLNYNYSIIGEVENEGRYISYDPDITIFDAILLAGNLTEFADRSNIKIIRKAGGKEVDIYYINLLDEANLSAQRLYLQRDDLIIVPALPTRTYQKYTLNNLTRTLGIIGTALSVTAILLTLGGR